MRNLTPDEIKAIKQHFDKIATQYIKLANCTTTQEFKSRLIELARMSEDQPKALTNLWGSFINEIQHGSN